MSEVALIVEDEPAVQELLRHTLRGAGFEVLVAGSLEQGISVAREVTPRLAIVDWHLGMESGLSLVRMLRADIGMREAAIIMVTCRDSEQDKVLALECGADDYLTKPFSPRELIARVHAVKRRMSSTTNEAPLILGSLRINPVSQRVTIDNQPLTLRPKEFQLLCFLARAPGRIYSRSQLLDQVWGTVAEMGERTVDAYVQRLRSSLEAVGHGALIETVRGVGYRCVETTHV